MTLYPFGPRSTWYRLGEIVHRLARGVMRPWVWPLRLYWQLLDRALWAWWWWGQGDEGAARWRWYRALEDRWQRAFDRVYQPVWGWVYRNIGE